MNEWMEQFQTQTTEEIAESLIGMYLEHCLPDGIVGGYIVDCEAYLGPEDEAAHSYGMRDTLRLKAMYQEPGTIYLYSMHGNLILNIVTQNIGIPQGVMIRGLEPIDGIEQMQVRREKTGSELSNGPGKLVAALGITKELYGRSIFTSPLRLVPEKKRQPKKIVRLPRIGIPNKGSWTNAPLRYVAWGNPYVTNIRKKEIDDHYGWSYE